MVSILTPSTLWDGFDGSLPLGEIVAEEISLGGMSLKYYFYYGSQAENGERVKICGLYAKPEGTPKGSILISPDVTKGINKDLVIYFAKKGYSVLCPDLRGKVEDTKYFTKYPDSKSYANYQISKDFLFMVKNSPKNTCWYEWACVLRYSINLLKKINPDSKVVGLGVKFGSNVLWQTAGVDDRFSACLFIFSGFDLKKYRDDTLDSEQRDGFNAFCACLDIQCYARKVNCPVFQFGGVDNTHYLCEEAYECVTAILKKSYFYFTPYSKKYLDSSSLCDINQFLEKYVEEKDIILPNQPVLKLTKTDNGINLAFEIDLSLEIKNIQMFYSFNDGKSETRSWIITDNLSTDGSGAGNFSINYFTDTHFNAFILVEYVNGFKLSSNFKECETEINDKNNLIIYSSGYYRTSNIYSTKEDSALGDIIDESITGELTVGPSGIKGISLNKLVWLYEFSKIKDQVGDESILKLDFYSMDSAEVEVQIKMDNESFYVKKIKLQGGKFWETVCIKFYEFVDENNIGLDDYSEIRSLRLMGKSEIVVNNILVVL